MRRSLPCVLWVVVACQKGSLPADAGPPDLAPFCLAGAPDAGTFPDPSCPIHRPAAADTLDEALTLAKLDRCSLGYSAADRALFPALIREDPWRLPWYDAVHDHAVRAPAFARDLVTRLDLAAKTNTPVTEALRIAGGNLGRAIAPCVAPPTLAEHPLVDALARVIRAYGGAPDAAALTAATASLPANLQAALAGVVLAASDANRAWLDLASPLSMSELGSLAGVSALVLPSVDFNPPDLTDAAVRDLLAHRFDESALVEAAVRLAYAIETAGLARFAGAKGFHLDVATPIGRVIVGDAADDVYADDGKGAILLLVDTGGNDTYRIPAGAVDGAVSLSDLRHVGVAIDLAGKDTYSYVSVPDPRDGRRLPSDGPEGRYHPTQPPTADNGPISLSEIPRQGAGRLGIGMLLDLGEEGDHYRSLRMSQGAGMAGVGVLYDAGGDDVYEGEAGVQGAAVFGVGLLLDAGGSDVYRTYAMSQGFGYTRGAGYLYDGAGSDRYLADVGDPQKGGDPLYLTPQLPGKGNSSFTQGAGFGRRAPGQNGDYAYMSGGIGVLRDLAGDDVYTTSVFGQATGYWFGTGILADGSGADHYDGKWYVQGADAHFALCVFLDDAGDDHYNDNLVPAATSIGVGHDFSVAWHIDGGGNDVYHAPGLSLGAGNANGLGVLVNLGGDDQYHSAGEPTIGCGNLSSEVDADVRRRKVPTTGIFIDVGGKDLYDVAGGTIARGDNTTWIDVREPPAKGITSEHGAGVDTEQGGVTLP